jgi:DNA topoisomerase-1
MKILFILESPGKVKTVSKYLNNIPELKKLGTFTVVASMGHVRDLNPKELGIDIENNFTPKYQVSLDKKKVVMDLQKKIREHDMVMLAADPDREGTAIAWHIQQLFKIKNYKRVVFHEITKDALKEAVLHPTVLDKNMVDSQQARRALDRIVGYKLSPLLWKVFKTSGSGLSAGRVQSAVLKIVADKEAEISKFKSQSYWTFDGRFKLNNLKEEAEGKLISTESVIFKETNEDKVKTLLKWFSGVTFKLKEATINNRSSKPDMPFITSSLQQEAYNKHGFGVKHTMKLAQDLYERGKITYMRTDSYNLSKDAITNIHHVIGDMYGTQHIETAPKQKKKANAQEAHECIRPSDVADMNLTNEGGLTKDHVKLYEMIWKRTVAYLMKAAVYEELNVKIGFDNTTRHFLGKFKRVKYSGYLLVYGQKEDAVDFNKMLADIKSSKITCKEIVGHNTWTQAPARFNESSIIKVLDDEGIGRPSTYASIMSKLYEKNYIIKQDVPGTEKEARHFVLDYGAGKMKEQKTKVMLNQEKNKLVISDIGKHINEFLEKNFTYIVDKQFTAKMEAELDKIAEGKQNYTQLMKGFYKEFSSYLNKVEKPKQKVELENTVLNFGSDIVVRVTRYGPVIQIKMKNGEKDKYINLKAYLRMRNIDYKDMTKKDVEFLLSFPYKIASKPDVYIHYGPYGLYLKHNEQNIRLPYKLYSKDNLETVKHIDQSIIHKVVRSHGSKDAKDSKDS